MISYNDQPWSRGLWGVSCSHAGDVFPDYFPHIFPSLSVSSSVSIMCYIVHMPFVKDFTLSQTTMWHFCVEPSWTPHLLKEEERSGWHVWYNEEFLTIFLWMSIWGFKRVTLWHWQHHALGQGQSDTACPEPPAKTLSGIYQILLKISDGYILFSEHRVLACTVKLLAVNVASASRAPVNWLIAHSAISASCLLSA